MEIGWDTRPVSIHQSREWQNTAAPTATATRPGTTAFFISDSCRLRLRRAELGELGERLIGQLNHVRLLPLHRHDHPPVIQPRQLHRIRRPTPTRPLGRNSASFTWKHFTRS